MAGRPTPKRADKRPSSSPGARMERRPDDPGLPANVAFTVGHMGEPITTMVAIADRAVILNPSYA